MPNTSKQILIAGLALLLMQGSLPALASEADIGLQMVAQRSFRSALDHLNRALDDQKLEPAQESELLLARGLSYKALLDDGQAVTNFQEALALNAASAEACYQLGTMYGAGRGVIEDADKELELMARAAEKDHVQAQRVLAQRYFRRDPDNLRKSHSWLMKAAKGEDTEAQRLLAARYSQGVGLIQNSGEAFKWFLKAAEAGDPIAQFQVAKSYLGGKAVQKDMLQALNWLERSAGQGYLQGQVRYAGLLAGGDGVKKNPGAATRWFWRASEQGHADARVRLAERYLRGEGVEQNFSEALRWFSKSRSKPLVQYYLGEMYEKGLGVESDMKRAFSFYRRSAKERLPQPMVKTAMMYMTGTGVEEDQSVAANYVRFLGSGSPGILNAAAWMLVTDENPQLRSGELAQSFLRKAKKEDSSYQLIDTQAAVYAELGKFKKAVRTQKKALDESGEDSEFRPEMEQHLAAYRDGKPWRESYGQTAAQRKAASEAAASLDSAETVFVGSIILLRAAKGFRRKGIVLDRGAQHVMEILVQKVESGFLPYGLHEYLVIYLNNPSDFYTRAREAEGILDYPLEPIRFILKESPVDGWHYEFAMDQVAEVKG